MFKKLSIFYSSISVAYSVICESTDIASSSSLRSFMTTARDTTGNTVLERLDPERGVSFLTDTDAMLFEAGVSFLIDIEIGVSFLIDTEAALFEAGVSFLTDTEAAVFEAGVSFLIGIDIIEEYAV